MIHTATKASSVVILMAAMVSTSHAVECPDPGLTQAIAQAMGRSPLAGECNARLYEPANSQDELVQVVRKTLTDIYANRRFDGAISTQKLPLKNKISGAKDLAAPVRQ